FVGQVIFAIGASMVVLSPLVFLPPWVVGLAGVAIICGHNLFDDVRGDNLGQLGWLWDLLHTVRGFQLDEEHLFYLAYPLLPWFGVMAAGYGFGMLLAGDAQRRRVRL